MGRGIEVVVGIAGWGCIIRGGGGWGMRVGDSNCRLEYDREAAIMKCLAPLPRSVRFVLEKSLH